MQLDRSTQKALVFFLILVSTVALINIPKLFGSSYGKEEAEAISHAKARELTFIKKQAEYYNEHGHKKKYEAKTGKVYE